MPGKRVQFDDATWHALDQLAKDRMQDAPVGSPRIVTRMAVRAVAPGTVGIIVLIEPLPTAFGPPQRVRAKFGDYISTWLMPAQLVIMD
jgi:hypothetical protein